jgi:alkylated DNA repair dioxygenase AlkB
MATFSNSVKIPKRFDTPLVPAPDERAGGVPPKGAGDARIPERIALSGKSFLELHADAVACDSVAFGALAAYLSELPPTPNPMNAKTYLRRRQGTFGATYNFGSQTSQKMGGDDEAGWPDLVRRCLRDARSRVGEGARLAVHANYYPDGAGVGVHYDKDGPFDHNKPILSYTFLSDPILPRDFDVYRGKASAKRKRDERAGAAYDKVLSLPLGHGSLLVMGGEMQSEFLHGVTPVSTRKFKNHVRINLTIRHMKY